MIKYKKVKTFVNLDFEIWHYLDIRILDLGFYSSNLASRF